MPPRWLRALLVAAAGTATWCAGPAVATMYSVACDYTAITNAIAGAVPGDTIQIAAGTATLTAAQVITISNSTLGISLIGAGPGKTILQKVRRQAGLSVATMVSPHTQASGTNDQAIIFMGANSGASGSGLPTTITNITFKNTGVIDGPRSSGNSTYRAISIRGVGGSDQSRGQIYNCEFLDFADSGIILADVTVQPLYWDIHNNLFNGSRFGVYLNGNGNCSVYDNIMRNYVVGVSMDANDAVSDVVISGNSFLGASCVHGPVSLLCAVSDA